mgnify:CR=1 FL=1
MLPATLGLRQNLRQFILLVIVNAFVGGMIGLERSILPLIAEQEFHLAATSAVLSFIVVFGIVKAITNYFTGTLANRFGRRKLLITGWIMAIPVPFLLMSADQWTWIVVANILLGLNQGLAWSATVVMKIDLVGERQRGFAMGLNEFAGYLAVALVAFLTGYIASHYGIRPYPFYIGILLVVLGLLFSIFLVRDTRKHVELEAKDHPVPRLRKVFWDTTIWDRNLGSVTQAGLVNNLNDGMAWGLLPILLASKGFGIAAIGTITAIYPAVWGIAQLFTGKMSDRFCKKSMLYWGMFSQGIALLLLVLADTFFQYILLSIVLGLGTALVYPTFLATVAENTHPLDRAESLGVFRLWRDMGYAIGALLTGLIADQFGINASITVIGILTLISALVIEYRMRCRTEAPRLTDWLLNRKKKSCRKAPANNYTSSETLAGFSLE